MPEDFSVPIESDPENSASYLDVFFPDRNKEIQTPTNFKLEYEFDIHVPESKQEELRTQVLDRIKEGRPLHVFGDKANGDSLLIHAATHYVLSKVCAQEGLDPKEIDLRLCDPQKDYSKGADFFNLTGESNQRIYAQIGYDPNHSLYPRWFYARHAQMLAKTIGVELSEEHFQKVPALHKTDSGPMSTFKGEAELKLDGQRLRGQLRTEMGSNGEIVVILQSGSFSEKRYSDEDITQISQALKARNPRSRVIVVSDKKFLSDEVSRGQEASYTDYPISERFPIKASDFQQELARDISTDSVDQIVYPEDMHEFSTYCYAADSLYTTDSFWGHAGAGAKSLRHGGILPEDSVSVLYTMADPNAWAIPGALNVQSEASYRVFNTRQDAFTVMKKDQYHRSSRDSDRKHGIEKKDVQRVIAAINDKKQV